MDQVSQLAIHDRVPFLLHRRFLCVQDMVRITCRNRVTEVVAVLLLLLLRIITTFLLLLHQTETTSSSAILQLIMAVHHPITPFVTIIKVCLVILLEDSQGIRR